MKSWPKVGGAELKQRTTVEPVAPKLPYPDDDNRGTKAAKRRRLTDIKDQARGCLALYDVQAEIKKEIREMEEMKENCWAKICESEEHFEKLCKATVADFFPGGKYGPKDPDDEVEEYDTEELKEESVDTPPLKFTEEENKMLDANVLACMRGWQKEGEILDEKAKLPLKKVLNGVDITIISSEEDEEYKVKCNDCQMPLTKNNSKCVANHIELLHFYMRCITCGWPLSKNCRCPERTYAQYLSRKTKEKSHKREPEMPGFLPGVMTPLHRCTPECEGKVHLQ